jgi:hypothetical protein
MNIGITILIFLALLCLLSKPIRNQFKPFLLPFLIFSGLSISYYAITGKSPFLIPTEVNNYFSETQTQDEPSHTYYQDPEKRYGKQAE